MNKSLVQINPQLDQLLKLDTIPSSEEATAFLEALNPNLYLEHSYSMSDLINKTSQLNGHKNEYEWNNWNNCFNNFSVFGFPNIKKTLSCSLNCEDKPDPEWISSFPLFVQEKITSFTPYKTLSNGQLSRTQRTLTKLTDNYKFVNELNAYIGRFHITVNELFEKQLFPLFIKNFGLTELNESITKCKQKYPNDVYFAFVPLALYQYIKHYYHPLEYNQTYIFTYSDDDDDIDLKQGTVLAASQIEVGYSSTYGYAWEKVPYKYNVVQWGAFNVNVKIHADAEPSFSNKSNLSLRFSFE